MLKRNDEPSDFDRSSLLKDLALDESINPAYSSSQAGTPLDSSRASEPYLKLLEEESF